MPLLRMGFGFMVRNEGGKETPGTRRNLLYVLNAHLGKRKSRVETLPGAIAILRCLAHCLYNIGEKLDRALRSFEFLLSTIIAP